jgi:ABC-type multidrug transport system ATPase subunit
MSGGERQRLSIARALLKSPPILVLDEATSSVDSISENRIRSAIEQLLVSGRTCFIIAHRLSTIIDADRIIVMDAGRVVGQGTHQELHESNTFYQQLYNEQFAGTPAGSALEQTVPVGEEEFLMRDGEQDRRIIVRTLDTGNTRVEVTPMARSEA